jgi:DUF1365 family protein
MRSALYRGRVTHARLRPVAHRFGYRVFYGLFDIDELPALSRMLRLFSFERFNVFSLRSSDHGPDDGTPLRGWAERQLRNAGIELDGGRIELLAFPRVLGYVFNPISVWYCYGPGGELRAVMHEVRNTFGDKHTYVVPVDGVKLRHEFAKELHVSPFMDMQSIYRFAGTLPGERVSVSIDQRDSGGPLFRACLRASRREFNDRNLLGLFFTHPLVTLKAMTAIHWEALRLWRKRVPFHRRPQPKSRNVSIVGSREAS